MSEATRWVEEAMANAAGWFPDVSEQDLRGPLEQAFEQATRGARGEREFHALFEAELRRAMEERAVLGSAESVLPVNSPDTPRSFSSIVNGETEAIPSTGEDRATVDHDGASEDEGARDFAFQVGALRFHDGLSPAEIQHELGIDSDYYAESMRWLLRQADETLDGDYPVHLERGQMAGFAAGLETAERSVAVERHVGECPGCATYLADLLEAALRVAGPGRGVGIDAGGSAPRLPTGSRPVTYTQANAWTSVGARARSQRRRVPAVSIRAAELHSYARAVEATAPEMPDVTADVSDDETATAPMELHDAAPDVGAKLADVVEDRPAGVGPGSSSTTVSARPGGGRSRRLVGAVAAVAVAVVAPVAIVALSGGGGERDAESRLADATPRIVEMGGSERSERGRPVAAKRGATARERPARRRARKRSASRPAGRRQAAKHRRQGPRQRRTPAVSAPVAPRPAPATSAPSAPPQPAAPPTTSSRPTPSGPPTRRSQFGFERVR